MVQRELRGCGYRSSGISAGRRLLWPASAAFMGTALVGFWARLDCSVRLTGYRRLAGMAPWGCARESQRALLVFSPARTQRTLDLALLRVAAGWVGVR